MTDWREFVSDSVPQAPCRDCGVVSPRRPRGWIFRYLRIAGNKRGGSTVRTERLCPECAKAILRPV